MCASNSTCCSRAADCRSCPMERPTGHPIVQAKVQQPQLGLCGQQRRSHLHCDSALLGRLELPGALLGKLLGQPLGRRGRWEGEQVLRMGYRLRASPVPGVQSFWLQSISTGTQPAGQAQAPTAISSSTQSQCVLPRLGSGQGGTCRGEQGCSSQCLRWRHPTRAVALVCADYCMDTRRCPTLRPPPPTGARLQRHIW